MLFLACSVIGVVSASVSSFVWSLDHIEPRDLHPHLGHMDSAFIQAYGFPFGYWIPFDPYVQDGLPKSHFLWASFLADVFLHGIFAFIVLSAICVARRTERLIREQRDLHTPNRSVERTRLCIAVPEAQCIATPNPRGAANCSVRHEPCFRPPPFRLPRMARAALRSH